MASHETVFTQTTNINSAAFIYVFVYKYVCVSICIVHICVTVTIKEKKAVNLRMGLLRRVGERVSGGAASGEGKGENNVTVFF